MAGRCSRKLVGWDVHETTTFCEQLPRAYPPRNATLPRVSILFDKASPPHTVHRLSHGAKYILYFSTYLLFATARINMNIIDEYRFLCQTQGKAPHYTQISVTVKKYARGGW